MPEFDAELIEGTRGGALVAVPDAAIEALGGGGRIKVTATFDGEPYRGSIATRGGRRILGVEMIRRGHKL